MIKKLKIDLNIIIPIICFFIISLISIKSALTYTSPDLGNLVFKQCIWYFLGTILIIFILHFKNNYLYENTIFLYSLGCILLLLLLFFGTPINNSKCWFTIPGIGSFQPSEFMKIFLMLTLAVMIKEYKLQYKNPSLKEEFKFVLKTLPIVVIPAILTFLEPDTGAVIMYLIIYFSMMILSGIRLRWFIALALITVAIATSILLLYYLSSENFIKILYVIN